MRSAEYLRRSRKPEHEGKATRAVAAVVALEIGLMPD
jgi:hypothetical protein